MTTCSAPVSWATQSSSSGEPRTGMPGNLVALQRVGVEEADGRQAVLGAGHQPAREAHADVAGADDQRRGAVEAAG